MGQARPPFGPSPGLGQGPAHARYRLLACICVYIICYYRILSHIILSSCLTLYPFIFVFLSYFRILSYILQSRSSLRNSVDRPSVPVVEFGLPSDSFHKNLKFEPDDPLDRPGVNLLVVGSSGPVTQIRSKRNKKCQLASIWTDPFSIWTDSFAMWTDPITIWTDSFTIRLNLY
jgi:hypothetical protein